MQFTTLISFVQSLGHTERPPKDAAGPRVIFVFAHGQPLNILPGLARRPSITVEVIVHQDVHLAERVLQSDGLVRNYGSDEVRFVEGVDY